MGKRKWVLVTGYVLVMLAWLKGFVIIPANAHPEAVALQYAMNISWLLTPVCSLVVLALIRIFLGLLLKKHTNAFRIVVLMSAVAAFAFGSLVWMGWIVFGIALLDPDFSSAFANTLYETGIVSFILNSPLSLLYSFHLFSTATVLLSSVFAGIFLSGAALMLFGVVCPWIDRIVYAVQRFALFRNLLNCMLNVKYKHYNWIFVAIHVIAVTVSPGAIMSLVMILSFVTLGNDSLYFAVTTPFILIFAWFTVCKFISRLKAVSHFSMMLIVTLSNSQFI